MIQASCQSYETFFSKPFHDKLECFEIFKHKHLKIGFSSNLGEVSDFDQHSSLLR
jgi:hypothetical protein